MSVIRQPGVLGRRRERRLVGITSALSAAAIEALTVGTWFALVAVESRTVFTALAGLGVLLFGSLLRAGLFGTVGAGRSTRSTPLRIATAVVLAACWLVWLLAAEHVGGTRGVAVGAVVLVTALVVQFTFERRAYYRERAEGWVAAVRRTVLPSLVLAAGASALLAATWFLDVTIVLAHVPLGERTLEFEAGALVLGVVCYGLCSFVAQQRRMQWLLTS